MAWGQAFSAQGSNTLGNPRTILGLYKPFYSNPSNPRNNAIANIFFVSFSAESPADNTIVWRLRVVDFLSPANGVTSGYVYPLYSLLNTFQGGFQQITNLTRAQAPDFVPVPTEPTYLPGQLFRLGLNQRARHHLKLGNKHGGIMFGHVPLKPAICITAAHDSATPTVSAYMQFTQGRST